MAKKKLFYKIGEACKRLEIQPYVLRYWETEFPFLDPDKSQSGQRVYGERDLEIIERIKVLLYDESGAWVLAKRRDRGTFAWPGESSAGTSIEYDEHRLMLLLRGFNAEHITPRRWSRRRAG